MTDRTTSFHVLRLLEAPGIGVVKVRTIMDMAERHKANLGDILADLNSINKVLKESQMDAFLSNEKSVLELLDRLNDMNVSILLVDDNEYPNLLKARLGKKAALFLAVLGNKSLLKKQSVGFCGSRKASIKGLETAFDCAYQLAREGLNIVSGYAAGIDMMTHRAALEADATTTIVLAEGILNFKIKQDIKNYFDLNRVAVISEILPGIPWSVRNAMQRNKTICALSQAMILIESGINGGSMAAGRTCLDLGVPLFAPVYEGMPATAVGNQVLLNQGARRLLKSRKTNKANINPVLELFKDESEQGNRVPKRDEDRLLW